MSTIDINSMTDEQLALVVSEARKRKQAKAKSQKYAAFEPTYSDYRKAVTSAKTANDLKKSLLADLKKLGFGAKVPKTTPTAPKTSKKK